MKRMAQFKQPLCKLRVTCRNSVFQQLQVLKSTRLPLDSKGFSVCYWKTIRVAPCTCVVRERQIFAVFFDHHLLRFTKDFCLKKNMACRDERERDAARGRASHLYQECL
jgi:hypothetical protein